MYVHRLPLLILFLYFNLELKKTLVRLLFKCRKPKLIIKENK